MLSLHSLRLFKIVVLYIYIILLFCVNQPENEIQFIGYLKRLFCLCVILIIFCVFVYLNIQHVFNNRRPVLMAGVLASMAACQ